jgi:hypothetical protein
MKLLNNQQMRGDTPRYRQRAIKLFRARQLSFENATC